MQHLEGSGTPVLYIGRTVLKGYYDTVHPDKHFKKDAFFLLLIYEIIAHTHFPMVQQPPVDHGLLIIRASRSLSDTPHPVGLLWTSDQLDAVTST